MADRLAFPLSIVAVVVGLFWTRKPMLFSQNAAIVIHRSQDDRTLYESLDEAGRRHGYWKCVGREGQIICEGRHVHGIPVWYKEYWPNGRLRCYRFENRKYELQEMQWDADGERVIDTSESDARTGSLSTTDETG